MTSYRPCVVQLDPYRWAHKKNRRGEDTIQTAKRDVSCTPVSKAIVRLCARIARPNGFPAFFFSFFFSRNTWTDLQHDTEKSQANVAPRRWQSCSGVRGDLREFATACCGGVRLEACEIVEETLCLWVESSGCGGDHREGVLNNLVQTGYQTTEPNEREGVLNERERVYRITKGPRPTPLTGRAQTAKNHGREPPHPAP